MSHQVETEKLFDWKEIKGSMSKLFWWDHFAVKESTTEITDKMEWRVDGGMKCFLLWPCKRMSLFWSTINIYWGDHGIRLQFTLKLFKKKCTGMLGNPLFWVFFKNEKLKIYIHSAYLVSLGLHTYLYSSLSQKSPLCGETLLSVMSCYFLCRGYFWICTMFPELTFTCPSSHFQHRG